MGKIVSVRLALNDNGHTYVRDLCVCLLVLHRLYSTLRLHVWFVYLCNRQFYVTVRRRGENTYHLRTTVNGAWQRPISILCTFFSIWALVFRFSLVDLHRANGHKIHSQTLISSHTLSSYRMVKCVGKRNEKRLKFYHLCCRCRCCCALSIWSVRTTCSFHRRSLSPCSQRLMECGTVQIGE